MNEGLNGAGENGLLGAHAPIRKCKAASSINCKDFNSLNDDFERWINRFEKAVKLATNMRDNDDGLHYVYKQWLPLKLDEEAMTHLDELDVDAMEWDALKNKMAELLVDPCEQLKWRSHSTAVEWDGKESIHRLAMRIKRGVDKYHKHYPPAVRECEYFNRFRSAFSPPLQRIIDMNCPIGHETMGMAKDALTRYHLTGSAGTTQKPPTNNDMYKSVTFAAGQLHPDRATSLETSMAAIATQMENMTLTMKSIDDRNRGLEERMRTLEEAQRYGPLQDDRRWDNPAPSGDSRGGGGWNNSGSNNGYQSPRGPSPGRNGFNGRQSRPEQRGNGRGNNNYGRSNSNNNYGRSNSNNNYGQNNNSYGNNGSYSNNSYGNNNSHGNSYGNNNSYGNSNHGNNNYGNNGHNNNNYGSNSGNNPGNNSGNRGYNQGGRNGSNNRNGRRPSPGQNGRSGDNYRAIDTEDEGDRHDEPERCEGAQGGHAHYGPPDSYTACYDGMQCPPGHSNQMGN